MMYAVDSRYIRAFCLDRLNVSSNFHTYKRGTGLRPGTLLVSSEKLMVVGEEGSVSCVGHAKSFGFGTRRHSHSR